MVKLVVDNGDRLVLDDQRRARLAQVHIARKALGMLEDDYRALLQRITGQSSAKHCEDRQLASLIAEFERMGWRPIGSGKRRRGAHSQTAWKARAMWISLYQLGAIENGSDAALEAFGRRQLRVDRLQWADARQAFRLIEALKAIANRHGWDQGVSSQVPAKDRVRLLKDRLVGAQLTRLAKAGVVVVGPLTEDRSTWSNKRLESAATELASHIRAIPKGI